MTDKGEVDGLPPSALGLAAQTARTEGHKDATPENGPWMLTLDFPSYMPVMSHAKNRCGGYVLLCVARLLTRAKCRPIA